MLPASEPSAPARTVTEYDRMQLYCPYVTLRLRNEIIPKGYGCYIIVYASAQYRFQVLAVKYVLFSLDLPNRPVRASWQDRMHYAAVHAELLLTPV